MSIWALIPVKTFSEAKSRLAGVLTCEQRAELAQAMFRDTFTAISQAQMIDRIAVVTNEPMVREFLRGTDATCIDDPNQGLNAALAAARDKIRILGARAIAIFPADLPELEAADIDAVVRSWNDTMTAVIVPAHDRFGTNALMHSAQHDFPLCFGPDSFRRHSEAARRCSLAVRSLDLPHVAADCDLPKDIDHFQHSLTGPYCSKFFSKTNPIHDTTARLS